VEAVLKINIPKAPHGPIDAVLSKLLDGIARLGNEGAAEAVSDRLTAASDSLEADLFIASLEIYLEHELDKLLTKEMHPVWPRVFADGQTAIDSEISRYLKANIEGSDRYTQSLPSSIACRVSPLNRSVENMTIAGDWTACGLDVGCVEAAVMSGMLAAYAISGNLIPDRSSDTITMTIDVSPQDRTQWARPHLEETGPVRTAGGLVGDAGCGLNSPGKAPPAAAEDAVVAWCAWRTEWLTTS